MDMKLVVVMGLPPEIEEEDSAKTGTEFSLARTMMVKHCQALTQRPSYNCSTLRMRAVYSGPPVLVDSALLQWALDCRVIPLVCPVGRDAAGHSSVLSPIQVTAAISQSLHPLKVIFLNSSGGIRNQNHKVGLNEYALAFCCRYSAAAIITTEPVNSGTPYLDKFVFSSSKQGQGTGQILWECIRQDLGKLFWRSRATNVINPLCVLSSTFVNRRWIVFWLGLLDIREFYELVEYAKCLPDSSCSHIATSVGE
uniref:N-acetylglutamate synthase n=1 Tax=Sinocyclocheilus rhinocerous TaxID=307959 RepID=A0A673H6U2_9TELE